MSEWISVMSGFPEHGIDVLCYWQDGIQSVHWYSESSHEWYTPDDIDEMGGTDAPLYWMPLPPPPDREE